MSLMGRVLVAFVVAASLGGCRGDSPSPAGPRAEPPKVPMADPAPDGSIAVEEFAAYVEREQPAWAGSPLRSALEFLGVSRPDAALTQVVERPGPEGSGPVTVTITRSGLGDDSVQAQRYILRFEAGSDGAWRLVSARWGQRCAPGRGHQRFSPRLCV
jgi:hypothetical protein